MAGDLGSPQKSEGEVDGKEDEYGQTVYHYDGLGRTAKYARDKVDQSCDELSN